MNTDNLDDLLVMYADNAAALYLQLKKFREFLDTLEGRRPRTRADVQVALANAYSTVEYLNGARRRLQDDVAEFGA